MASFFPQTFRDIDVIRLNNITVFNANNTLPSTGAVLTVSSGRAHMLPITVALQAIGISSLSTQLSGGASNWATFPAISTVNMNSNNISNFVNLIASTCTVDSDNGIAFGLSNTVIGLHSYAEGASNEVRGPFSHAEGVGTNVFGESCHTEGFGTTAFKFSIASHAEGINTIVSGIACHTEGSNTTTNANVIAAHAEGIDTNARANAAHAEGSLTIADGDSSHAEGNRTTASGVSSHAEGFLTTASGEGAHAEGNLTTASGFYAHAEGLQTNAIGNFSHAEGLQTNAIGNFSHAEGLQTNASNQSAHAEGENTIASGLGSHAQGARTVASAEASFAAGVSSIASNYADTVIGYGGHSRIPTNFVLGGGPIQNAVPENIHGAAQLTMFNLIAQCPAVISGSYEEFPLLYSINTLLTESNIPFVSLIDSNPVAVRYTVKLTGYQQPTDNNIAGDGISHSEYTFLTYIDSTGTATILKSNGTVISGPTISGNIPNDKLIFKFGNGASGLDPNPTELLANIIIADVTTLVLKVNTASITKANWIAQVERSEIVLPY